MNKQELIEKYRSFKNNLEWHVKTNEPREPELSRLRQRIGDMKEFLLDADALDETPPEAGAVDPGKFAEWVGSQGWLHEREDIWLKCEWVQNEAYGFTDEICVNITTAALIDLYLASLK